jgi:hypothetical protein
MSYTRQPLAKAGRRRERLTNTSIAASRARGVESTQVMSSKRGEGVHPSLNRAMPNSCSRKPCRPRWPDTTVVDQRHTTLAEERRRASLEFEIEQIRRHYQKQERILESEVVKHEKRYEWAIEQLENEDKEEVDCSVTEWWEVQSDYQPTERDDNDGSS